MTKKIKHSIQRESLRRKVILCNLLFWLIFAAHVFLQFWQLEQRTTFGWDQVDYAWAAKSIIVDHELPLLGTQQKYNSGIFLGPAYYYLITPFYYLTNLDPIAAGIIAGLSSIFSLVVIYILIKRLFSQKIALLAAFFYTFSNHIIASDRTQWPVNLVPPVSMIIFWALYQVVLGRLNWLPILAITLGFSFHLHFTAIIFPLIILAAFPLLPWSKKMLKYAFASLPLFVIWLLPNIVADIKTQNLFSNNLIDYLGTYYHGLHLVRVGQLIGDAFIEFEIVFSGSFKFLKYLALPVFLFWSFIEEPSKKRLVLGYLSIWWFLAPWLVFALYSGEISNYYFSLTRPIVLMIISYLGVKMFSLKNVFFKFVVGLYIVYFLIINLRAFKQESHWGLAFYRQVVDGLIKEGKEIEFRQGAPESYLYYIYSRQREKK